MNGKVRHQFLTGFDPEFTTSEGWARLVENVQSADLPSEQSLTCLYLCLRQYPNAVSNQVLLGTTQTRARETVTEDYNSNKSSKGDTGVDVPHKDKQIENLNQRLSACQARRAKHLDTILRLETDMYDIGCQVSSFHENIVMLEENLAKTNGEMVEMLHMMAEMKQITSGVSGRELSQREKDLYRRVAGLVARLEANRDTCLESITPIRVENFAHATKIAECKRVIRDLLRERLLEVK